MEEFEKMAATELEMEPEIAEADKAEPDEAAVSEGDEPENAEPDLGSNSPRGEEIAAAAETVEVLDAIAPESAAEPPQSHALEKAPADAMTPITAGTESPWNLSEPASSDSHQTAETEASHAEEVPKES
jgi:hypothetical protein